MYIILPLVGGEQWINKWINKYSLLCSRYNIIYVVEVEAGVHMQTNNNAVLKSND